MATFKNIHAAFGAPDKNYATIENAEKALKKALANSESSFRYTIAAMEVKGQVRYFPVVVLDRELQHMSGWIAHQGISVTF
jgi:hypothetical protein